MREARHEDALEVRHDGAEGLRILRRLGRQLRGNFPGSDPGKDRIVFWMLEVLGYPVNQLVAVLAERRAVHVSACANGCSRARTASAVRSVPVPSPLQEHVPRPI